MRQSVRDAFVGFSTPLEGCCSYMYSDIKNLITTGIGNLIDPVSVAVAVPFRKPDGSLASSAEKAAEFWRVKNDPRSATLGHRYAATITRLRLDDAGIADVVFRRLDLNESILRSRFPNFEEWPADAQLATHSLGWACGAAFRFPKLERALQVIDFLTAAVECKMNEAGNPGLIPRDKANATLYTNAAAVYAGGLDPDTLWFPAVLAMPPEAA